MICNRQTHNGEIRTNKSAKILKIKYNLYSREHDYMNILNMENNEIIEN